MARFIYTAERSDGEKYNGIAEAADRFELYQIIRREGGHFLSLKEDNNKNIFSISYWNTRLTSISEQSKIVFTRNLGSMLNAGLPLSRALSIMERQTKNPRLSAAISEIQTEIRHGNTLHAALGKFPQIFPKLMVAMIRAGEEGGNIASSLQLTADQMERMHNLKNKIRGAMLYPAIILIAIFIIGFLMMIFVVPTLAQTFQSLNATLPLPTRIVIGISGFLSSYTLIAVALILGVVALLYFGLHSKRGKRLSDYIFLHLPLIGPMVREVNAARTARTLASLVTSGVDVLTALEITGEVVQNSYFQEVIAAARVDVGQGEPLSTTFAKNDNLYPPFVGEMMAVGEETGQSSDMLTHLAMYYEDEVDRKTKDMSTIIEPFLMIFIGAAVGFFAVSMITPIYQLSQNIN